MTTKKTAPTKKVAKERSPEDTIASLGAEVAALKKELCRAQHEVGREREEHRRKAKFETFMAAWMANTRVARIEGGGEIITLKSDFEVTFVVPSRCGECIFTLACACGARCPIMRLGLGAPSLSPTVSGNDAARRKADGAGAKAEAV